MSVLNQHYIIENYNGEEERTSDISKYVEKYKARFRFVFGTNFNLRKFDKSERRWGSNKGNYFSVTLKDKNYIASAIGWRYEMHHQDRKAECLYVIRDGFGRIVHPDVIYNAYINERGAIKTKFTEQTYIGHWYYGTHGDVKRDRGERRKTYGSRVAKGRLRILREITAPLEEDEPKVRLGTNHRDYVEHIRSWDVSTRDVQKNWKKQNKAKKQWMKRV